MTFHIAWACMSPFNGKLRNGSPLRPTPVKWDCSASWRNFIHPFTWWLKFAREVFGRNLKSQAPSLKSLRTNRGQFFPPICTHCWSAPFNTDASNLAPVCRGNSHCQRTLTARADQKHCLFKNGSPWRTSRLARSNTIHHVGVGASLVSARTNRKNTFNSRDLAHFCRPCAACFQAAHARPRSCTRASALSRARMGFLNFPRRLDLERPLDQIHVPHLQS